MTWGRVVVGIDGSDGSQRALRFAADEAAAHRASLHVLLAYTVPPPPATVSFGPGPLRSVYAWREDAESLLTRTVLDTLGETPDVKVTTEVIEGSPAVALIDASRYSDLLVVGTRGHGGFAGMLLGSVSQHLAAHAACTTAVVR